MSKIEEMAANYSGKIYKEVQGDVPYTNLSDYKRGKLDSFDPYVEDAYIASANAVLEEIENIVYRRYSEDGDGTERNKDMIKLIKRLKGE